MQLETLELGIRTTITGMGIVFLVLITLSIITWLLSAIVDGSIQRKKARMEAEAPPTAPAAEPAITETVAAGINPQTVAAIIAAVGLASAQPLSQLRFTAIRRGGAAGNAWSGSSTADIIANRQAYL